MQHRILLSILSFNTYVGNTGSSALTQGVTIKNRNTVSRKTREISKKTGGNCSMVSSLNSKGEMVGNDLEWCVKASDNFLKGKKKFQNKNFKEGPSECKYCPQRVFMEGNIFSFQRAFLKAPAVRQETNACRPPVRALKGPLNHWGRQPPLQQLQLKGVGKNWKASTAVRALLTPRIQLRTGESLLPSTGTPPQCSVVTRTGRKPEREGPVRMRTWESLCSAAETNTPSRAPTLQCQRKHDGSPAFTCTRIPYLHQRPLPTRHPLL